MNNKRKKRLYAILAVLFFIFFILPSIGFGILNWGVLPPEKLTPLVINKTNEFLDAHLECEKIELTYFETWPYLGVKLTNGQLVSHVGEDSTAHDGGLSITSDSLLSFSKVTLSIQPMDYFSGGKVTIKELSIENPRIYGYVNDKGQANWEIYKTEIDSTTDEASSSLPPIDLQRVRITGGLFTYDDRQNDLFAEIKGFFLTIDGSLANGKNELDIKTGSSSNLFRSPQYNLSNKLSVKLESKLILSNNYNTVTLDNAELLLNKLPFTANGSVTILPKGMQIDMDMGLKVTDMNDILRFIPEVYLKDKEKTMARGSVTITGNIHGVLKDTVVPSVNLCCIIDDGAYHMQGVKQGIDKLSMDLDMYLNGEFPDSSYLSLEDLTMEGLNTAISMRGKISNLTTDPSIEANINGKIDFTRFAREFINPDTLLVEGKLNADFITSFTLDDLSKSQYGKMKGYGTIDIDSFKAQSRLLDMDMLIRKAHLSLDSTQQESSYLGDKNLLGIKMSVDSLSMKYKDEISTKVSRLTLIAKTSPIVDTTSVIPLTGSLTLERLITRLPDSVWLIAGKTVLQGGIKPSATNKLIPTAGASITADTIKYIIPSIRTGAVLVESTFGIEAKPYQRKHRQGARRDSATWRRNARRADSLSVENPSNQLLRQWEVNGNVRFKEARGFSRLLPIPAKMESTTVQFSTDKINLSGALLRLDKSDLTLSGEIKDIRRAMLRGGKLKADFSLTSSYLDCNQIIQALSSGMIFSEEQETKRKQPVKADSVILSTITNSLMQDSIIAQTSDTVNQLFVIPSFLDMTLHTHVKNIDYKDLKLENVSGKIIIRDQVLNLDSLNMNSNIGSGNLTMVYTAKDARKASAGFDLDVKDIQVNKLIGLFPSIDTLMPMLRSFEGVVGCQIAATCEMDSSMSLLIPSIHSACHLHGENMVLLDGEAFAEISKTLMFKNKKRNMIDSISVDLTIKDNKVEVFPFLVEIDRYKVAVGGTQNLDMSFKYHISVLKSPVPFKLGINITGTIDKYKFRIGKCLYKDIFKPAKEASLDSTKINLRQQMHETILDEIRKAAPPMTGSLEMPHTSARDTVEGSTS